MSTEQTEARLARARLSLEGLSVGDGFGMRFEFASPSVLAINIQRRELLAPPWRYTDDTNMALSIYAILRRYGEIRQDELAAHFARHFERERGYGMGARKLLIALQVGGTWREIAPQMFGGGSFGNGGAMRVAPLGAYFADDWAELVRQARLSAEITHAHPEGIAGTIAVALGAALASNLHGQPKPSIPDFLARLLPHIPDGLVKQGVEQAQTLPPETSIETLILTLGNGSGVSAQDTVPLVLWMAACYLDNYEEAIWATVSAGGDADTTAAMVGGIVALYVGQEGIPAEWLKRREPLPEWAFVD